MSGKEDISDDEEVFNVAVKDDKALKEVAPSTKQTGRKKKKEPVLVPMVEKPKQKRTRSEEAEKAMKERLAQLRIKAFEKRMENKKLREQQKQEEAEKIEKVNKFLKNDDLFEKKYADKFEKITDMITNVSSDVNELKEYKKQKQLKKQKAEEDRLAREAEQKEVTKEQAPQTQAPQTQAPPIQASPLTATQILSTISSNNKPTLPNYRKMNFGNKQKYF